MTSLLRHAVPAVPAATCCACCACRPECQRGSLRFQPVGAAQCVCTCAFLQHLRPSPPVVPFCVPPAAAGPLGSPGFVAPEIIADGVHTPAMDVFSLGVLLFIMLVGAFGAGVAFGELRFLTLGCALSLTRTPSHRQLPSGARAL